MMRIISSAMIFITLLLPSATFAQFVDQTVQRIDQRTLARSIQCETGLFAQALRGLRIPASRMNASAKITDKIERGWGFGGDLSALILAKFSAGVTHGNTYSNVLSFRRFNLNVANVAACRDRNTVALHDLRRCLRTNAEFFAPRGPLGAGDSNCLSQVNVKVQAYAGLSVPFNVVTIGPHASFETDYVYGVQIVAPAGGSND
ncbi:hypothetical protein Rpal_3331 [Rhodopseudomonas palustris TIE-1]|uniref:hypothetical protein n=1 Tax=Rhodopseudomonas palustris TaxID=1076 RepID=UPI0001779749|nr:hypothetical protein [Rhodopseudomonas palustris]ACF01833.1 hypothetical protein Rpal_3331 [Rhodopseudomonas palustris TIE-1]